MAREIGINKETTETTEGGKFIRVVDEESAIQEGRFIESIEVGDAANGNAYLQVNIVDKEGKTANKRFFEPSLGQYIESDEALDKADQKLIKVVANLLRRFRGEGVSTPTLGSWKEMFEHVKKEVEGTTGWQNKELRIKLILNKEDFPTLPGYAPIFEDISVPKDQSKLKIEPDFNDRVTKKEAPAPSSEGANAPEIDF